MTFILLAVTQKVAVQLLEMVLGDVDVVKGVKNHLHRLGIACNLLLIAAVKFLDFQLGEKFFDLTVC